jgi:hypothetical protein
MSESLRGGLMALTKKQIAEYAFDLQVGLEGIDVPEYDVAKTIGMAAVLAVNLRGLPEIQYGTLRLVASRLFHIRSDVLDTILRTLADLHLVKLVTTGGTIQQVIPDVPHFEDVYTQVGEYTDAKPLNELEQITVAMLDQLYRNPVNRDALRAKLGADNDGFKQSLQIGVDAGLMIDQRARGRDIIASPMYFSGNLDGLIDVAARGDTPNVQRLLKIISKNQGMPLSCIIKDKRISNIAISPDDVPLLASMAEEGIIKPPSILRPNKVEEKFLVTPAPGKTRMSAANREIYEKGMALAAAVRKGQLLPEEYRIRNPQALLYVLGDRKWIKANTEAAHQYKNLAVLGLGRLESAGGGFYRFRLIDVPENLEAVDVAKKLLLGEEPQDMELDNRARLLLTEDETYVKSHLVSADLRREKKKTVMSEKAEAEVTQFLLKF